MGRHRPDGPVAIAGRPPGGLRILPQGIWARRLLAGGVSVALLAAAVHMADTQALGVALQGRAVWPITLVCLMYVGNGALKALRWWWLLRIAGRRADPLAAYRAFLVGMAVNNLLPGGLAGEPVRVAHLEGRVSRASGGAAAADRILDAAVMAAAGIAAAPLLAGLRPGLATLLQIAAGLLAVAVLVAAPLVWHRLGMHALARRPAAAALAALLTLPIQANDALRLMVLARLYDIDLGFWRAVAIVAVATLTGIVAVLGGGAGLALGVGALLGAFGAPPPQAAACALVFVATSTWLSYPLGAAAAAFGRPTTTR